MHPPNETHRSFEAEWPGLADRLQGLLGSKSLPPWRRDDVVQETGLRLFGMWGHVDDRPLWPLTVTIALNLLRDEARRRPEREVLGAVPERAGVEDVEQAGLARLEFQRVKKALRTLSPSHRSVLLVELGGDPVTDRGPNAIKMLRLRARRELSAMLEKASAGVGVVGLTARRIAASVQDFMARRGLAAGGESVPAASLLAALVAVSLAPALFGSASPGASTDRRGVGVGGRGMTIAADETAIATPKLRGGLASTDRTAPTASKLRNKKAGTRPLTFPIPGGNDSLEGRAWVEAAGFGADVGDHNGSPVCVMGLNTMPPPELQCEREASNGIRAGGGVHTSKVEAHAHAEVE